MKKVPHLKITTPVTSQAYLRDNHDIDDKIEIKNYFWTD